ncbi:uncharacterized protein LOC114352730 [Ostrinia furnacalis]|uniref:uncharacterized protein LOC114352730 n=1 Tax=Ostrinia furnacalis TaxID=93504 RepID=UPI00103D1ECB|nr:uncharacterized protein LOC114352730 [Ostrinia furnacalis]
MLSSIMFMLFSVIVLTFSLSSGSAEMLLQQQPSLYLYSPGELEFADVIVKQAGDNLTLICELKGETAPAYYWNYLSFNNTVMDKPYTITSNSTGSQLVKLELSPRDSGRVVCSAPPASRAKHVLVQPPHAGASTCAHGAFACGARCVLAMYVCDGRRDCAHGEDEAPVLCGEQPCARSERLNCSSGRCIPAAACCRAPSALCRQPSCCDEHPRFHGAVFDLEPPSLYDDRHASDDYGFIQSTIYTVTACALIFMIAVVLLVSAVCKMHMKRAALRSYARADRLAREHAIAQRHRFPPCYDAGLLERSPLPSPQHRDTQCGLSTRSASPTNSERRPRLAALTSVFTSRYRQVPTQCTEVEMTAVTSTATSSPSRLEYRSPAGGPPCEGAPHLNASHEHPDRHRLTLQLGRFQLSIPRFGRAETRPDTPNVAEINIDDLDFVRLNASDTYTLNGRTIRLLGADFQDYPTAARPPPYNEAMRYKLYGPPPEYLSRDRLHRTNSVDEEARSNVEMPPGYDELSTSNNGISSNGNNGISNTGNNGISDRIVIDADVAASNVIGILDVATGGPVRLIGESSNNNVFDTVIDNNDGNNAGNVMSLSNSSSVNMSPIEENATCIASRINLNNNTSDRSDSESKLNDNDTSNGRYVTGNGTELTESNGNETVETLKSVIDNLPAIDCDVNANDSSEGVAC